MSCNTGWRILSCGDDSSGAERGLKCDAHQLLPPPFQQDREERRAGAPQSHGAQQTENKKKGKMTLEGSPPSCRAQSTFYLQRYEFSFYNRGLARGGCHLWAGGAGREAEGGAGRETGGVQAGRAGALLRGCWPVPAVWVSSSGVLPTHWKCFQASCSGNRCLGNKTVFLPPPPTHTC